MYKLCRDKGFASFAVNKDGMLIEFILNSGFVDGVTESENYHFHSSYEIHACVRGWLHILADDKDIFLREGEIAILAPGTVHYIFSENNSYRISYRFKIAQTKNSDMFKFLIDSYTKLKSISVIKGQDIYDKYLRTGAENFKSSKPDFFVSELLYLATYEMAERICEHSIKNVGTKNAELMSEEIEEFINAHYSLPTTLTDLAAHLNFSPRHTERIVNKIFGISFSEILTRKRLSAARLLLRTTDIPISTLIAQVGFSDSSYFCRKFSEAFKISPSKYREMNKRTHPTSG